MIKEITIKNFKSIDTLTLELGQFNVLIGENGCGKTNILEAIALGGAAAARKLDNEFLSSRGIRVTQPEWMRAAFDSSAKDKEIIIQFKNGADFSSAFRLGNENTAYSKWKNIELDELSRAITKDYEEKRKTIDDSKPVESQIRTEVGFLVDEFYDELDFIKKRFPLIGNPELSNFIIYTPENTTLRVFEKEGQILPLGIKGEGLFKLIKNLSLAENKGPIEEIKENLALIDWFDDFQLPEAGAPGEFVLKIKDRFLDPQLNEFDQRSSNEGFLFLLFYLSLFVSKDTPTFFAIDNVEAAFNPKLCVEVTKTLIRLAMEKKKQVIVTTQNPSILDGINLFNPDERLFVIKRNTMGHTIATRIETKPDSQSPVKLSEAWTRGYIGGLPKNF